jgi:hypothetical protein
MRTTVTLDDDLARALKRRAFERELPFKQVLNEAVRTGLASGGGERKPYRMKPGRPLRSRPGIDLVKASQLADQLEDEEIVRKLQQGR